MRVQACPLTVAIAIAVRQFMHACMSACTSLWACTLARACARAYIHVCVHSRVCMCVRACECVCILIRVFAYLSCFLSECMHVCAPPSPLPVSILGGRKDCPTSTEDSAPHCVPKETAPPVPHDQPQGSSTVLTYTPPIRGEGTQLRARLPLNVALPPDTLSAQPPLRTHASAKARSYTYPSFSGLGFPSN